MSSTAAAKTKSYYVNSQKYRFHKDFLLANYLVARGEDVFTPIYINENRRFIVGTIAWQKPVEKFTFELWEGDLASADLIKLAHDTINKTFFEEVAYKPNSTRQDDASESLGIKRISADEISKNQEYLALNTGKAVGRIHIIEKLDDTVEIGDNEICNSQRASDKSAAGARNYRGKTFDSAFAHQYFSRRVGEFRTCISKMPTNFLRSSILFGFRLKRH
ncbi:MAG: hypothetical protein WKF71_19960 [Pyrinomonadaceae bacterium]